MRVGGHFLLTGSRLNDDVTAFVMAGGRSTRMGQDKATLDFGGLSLLEHAIASARAVTPRVKIVGSANAFASFGPVVEDFYRGQGPLGGIHAALRSSHTELNLILAVDMPLLEPRLFEFLILKARQSKAMVTVPSAAGRFQTLCAVYCRAFAEVTESALREGKNKIDMLFSGIEICTIKEPELLAAGFSPLLFTNLNTPEEFERAQQARKSHAFQSEEI